MIMDDYGSCWVSISWHVQGGREQKSHNYIASNLQVGEQEAVIRRIDSFVTFCVVVCHGSQPSKPGFIASQPSTPGLIALDFPDQSWGVYSLEN